ncbi:MAG: hypothetical protein PHY31_10230 [Smithellaceae bacterium]|nr:hypothetical protein [Smithellaceae bacterium]
MSYKEGGRKTFSKFDCQCAGCGKRIKKGQEIFLDPKTRKAYCCNINGRE